jgi:hypothetical protein
VPKISTSTKIQRDQGAIDGIRAHLSKAPRVQISDVEYAIEELVQIYDDHLKAIERVRELTIARRTAVQEERALEKRVLKVHPGLKTVAVAKFGKYSTRLLEFGIPPEKKPKMSAGTKKRANDKRQATRKERGVMGKRQLAAWKKKRKAEGR